MSCLASIYCFLPYSLFWWAWYLSQTSYSSYSKNSEKTCVCISFHLILHHIPTTMGRDLPTIPIRQTPTPDNCLGLVQTGQEGGGSMGDERRGGRKRKEEAGGGGHGAWLLLSSSPYRPPHQFGEETREPAVHPHTHAFLPNLFGIWHSLLVCLVAFGALPPHTHFYFTPLPLANRVGLSLSPSLSIHACGSACLPYPFSCCLPAICMPSYTRYFCYLCLCLYLPGMPFSHTTICSVAFAACYYACLSVPAVRLYTCLPCLLPASHTCCSSAHHPPVYLYLNTPTFTVPAIYMHIYIYYVGSGFFTCSTLPIATYLLPFCSTHLLPALYSTMPTCNLPFLCYSLLLLSTYPYLLPAACCFLPSACFYCLYVSRQRSLKACRFLCAVIYHHKHRRAYAYYYFIC